ncbi:30S ribosomal protein S15 [Borrelia miyamotoi]|uniref:Small ribosomal subunit protein uS15 n=1 Tax=Borrelia miyamotoi TaxID=47466 RepID=A0AAX3JLH5_9SPIR|nr:30S ribosomal protein S15 [Borrelia miyamotoi]ASQ29527.1 30S ribosomal protein S15 [Borrelia miyamotoi]QFP41579.1 30S ribosomal protein S15 [Borrelia miyamotoi]QFP47699.1 30S ribosomal protein S15 [Borrelia miyamotoi]QGT55460.1 30S ribosomal protein S15 [Borrelia miyamotoi]QGT56243.1 30S ribosomal protein S15 [Borrelia miyamotoi]
MVSKEQKQKIITEFGKNSNDTGSVEVQIALITGRIRYLTEHLKINKKDHSSKRGLLKLVGQRRSLLRYYQKKNLEAYRTLIAKLGLRK